MNLAGRIEQALFGLYLVVLVWAPLPFASNRPWATGLLATLVGALLCAWLCLYLLRRVQVAVPVWRLAALPLAGLVLVQCWVLLQLVPLPRGLLDVLSPQASLWHWGEGWRSLSLDQAYGGHYLLRGLTLSAAFFLVLALINSTSRVRLLLQVLVFSGTFQAVYGSLMVLSGLELGFFVEKYTGRGLATGTFVNRNHLAGYLVMCLSAGIGLMFAQWVPRQGGGWRGSSRRWLQMLLSGAFRLRIYLALMVIALVLTRSRMGNLSFFLALVAAGLVATYAGQRFSRRILALLASLFLLDMLVLGQWFGFDRLLQRFTGSPVGEESRLWSSTYTLDYIAHFPLTGSGGGSFYGVFHNFQQERLEGFHVHAHNDYLEFAAELGIPVALLLMAIVLRGLHCAVDALRERRHPLLRGAAFAVIMTMAWAALHALTDFNFQIPANALTFVTLLALAFVCRALPVAKRGEGQVQDRS